MVPHLPLGKEFLKYNPWTAGVHNFARGGPKFTT